MNMGAIEDIIKQNKKFADDYQKVSVSILYLYNLLNDQLQDIFKPFEITSQQYNVLRILRGQHPKPATVGLIKERMIDRNSDASRIVERLRKAGLVERVVCESDRRAVDVVITEKGLSILSKIDPLIIGNNTPLHQLSKDEIQQLDTLIDKLLSRWVER